MKCNQGIKNFNFVSGVFGWNKCRLVAARSCGAIKYGNASLFKSVSWF